MRQWSLFVSNLSASCGINTPADVAHTLLLFNCADTWHFQSLASICAMAWAGVARLGNSWVAYKTVMQNAVSACTVAYGHWQQRTHYNKLPLSRSFLNVWGVQKKMRLYGNSHRSCLSVRLQLPVSSSIEVCRSKVDITQPIFYCNAVRCYGANRHPDFRL